MEFDELAKSSINLAKDVMKGIHDTEDRKRARYYLGILYPNENRDLLVTQGRIPAAYSSRSIKMGLKEGNLPKNWTDVTAILQGFGPEVDDYLTRINSEIKTSRDLLQQKLEETEQGIVSAYDKMYLNNFLRKQLSFYK
jgi:hypothetical protein